MPILTPQEKHKTATHLTNEAERLRREGKTADAEQAEKLAFSMRQIALYEEKQKRIQNALTPSEIENLRETAKE